MKTESYWDRYWKSSAVQEIIAADDKERAEARAARTVRCPDHRNGGATRCPRGGAALQIWQRKQWGD